MVTRSESRVSVTNLALSVGRLPKKEEPTRQVLIDLQIEDSEPFRLSRMHFALFSRSNGPGILDLGSTLGTEVNGEFLGYNSGKDFTS